MLHYYVQQFFKPVSITGHVENDKLKVYRVTDHPSDALNLVLSVKVYKWGGFDVLWMKNVDVVESQKASVSIVSIFSFIFITFTNFSFKIKILGKMSGKLVIRVENRWIPYRPKYFQT